MIGSLLIVSSTLFSLGSSFTSPLIGHKRNSIVVARQTANDNTPSKNDDRRDFLKQAFVTLAAGASTMLPVEIANASGGATAGKYTTIPIAKRRYYGRVQQSIHEFLLMGPAVVKGDLRSPEVLDFFDVTKTVIVEARSQSINGACTKKDKNCKGAEVRDSRYNDMKTSMYLLGNAFRINQQKAPDSLPSVRASKAFFKEMDAIEKSLSPKKINLTAKNPKEVQTAYLTCLDILDVYLDLVELPPLDSGNYEKTFSTKVGSSARIT